MRKDAEMHRNIWPNITPPLGTAFVYSTQPGGSGALMQRLVGRSRLEHSLWCFW
jgi:hypothetical protein